MYLAYFLGTRSGDTSVAKCELSHYTLGRVFQSLRGDPQQTSERAHPIVRRHWRERRLLGWQRRSPRRQTERRERQRSLSGMYTLFSTSWIWFTSMTESIRNCFRWESFHLATRGVEVVFPESILGSRGSQIGYEETCETELHTLCLKTK